MRSVTCVLRFFDAAGKPTVTDLDERIIAIRHEQIRRIRRVVGIAGGKRKRERAALLGGWVNVIITDRLTAEFLL